MDKTIVKSFDFEEIDMVQMAEAIRTLEGSQIHILRNRSLYDRLFWPLERLFAYDMPLRDRLHRDRTDKWKSNKLYVCSFYLSRKKYQNLLKLLFSFSIIHNVQAWVILRTC